MKIYLFRKDPDGLSVMNPDDYKTRFQRKVDEIFDLDGKPGGIGTIIEELERQNSNTRNSLNLEANSNAGDVELSSIYPRNSYNAKKEKGIDTSVYNPMNDSL